MVFVVIVAVLEFYDLIRDLITGVAQGHTSEKILKKLKIPIEYNTLEIIQMIGLVLMLLSCLCEVCMKDYYNLFVELSLQQCTKNDYANKLKVKKHNAASKRLEKLQDEMKENVSEDILFRLMNHEDDRVKINVASFCLQSEILIDQALLALKKIINVSDDSTICFSAKMLLKNTND